MKLSEFTRETRGARLFDLWTHPGCATEALGQVGVELQTRMDAAPSPAMLQTAEEATAVVDARSHEFLSLIFGHYKLAEREGWLDFWNVRLGLSKFDVLTEVDSLVISVHDDLYCCLHVDPSWDPEHKLYLTIAEGRITDVNGDSYTLVGETLELGLPPQSAA